MDPAFYLVAVDVVLVVGAALRLTRLVVVDTVGFPVRYALLRSGKAISPRALAWADELVGCPHCIGFWVSLAVFASWLAWGDAVVWRVAAATLALSYVVGHLSGRLDVEEEA